MSRVNPDDDVPGSYGDKLYNGSCDALFTNYDDDSALAQKYVRTCSTGVQSCFGATGIFDQNDDDPSNDLSKTTCCCTLACIVPRHEYSQTLATRRRTYGIRLINNTRSQRVLVSQRVPIFRAFCLFFSIVQF
jgi:hypothetical protein